MSFGEVDCQFMVAAFVLQSQWHIKGTLGNSSADLFMVMLMLMHHCTVKHLKSAVSKFCG